MSDATAISLLVSMLVAGLASSLHCIGMCGPILAGFSTAFDRARLTVEGKPVEEESGRRRYLRVEFVWYHIGRLWTYTMLGLTAGVLGRTVFEGTAGLGWQRGVSIASGVLVVLTGVILLGVIPGLKVDRLINSCGTKFAKPKGMLSALVHAQGPVPRLLLGAIMGLLPCGVIYAMLVLVATFHNPLLSAAGMLAFGIGTLPALTGVLIAAASLPARVVARGTQLAAIVVVLCGIWMIARVIAVGSPETGCPFCVPGESATQHVEQSADIVVGEIRAKADADTT